MPSRCGSGDVRLPHRPEAYPACFIGTSDASGLNHGDHHRRAVVNTTADEAAPTSTATQPTATNTKPAKDAKPPKAKKKSPPAKPQQTAKPAVAKAQPAPEKPVLIAKAQAPTLPPPAENQSIQSAPSSHAVNQLVNQVEKEYQAGQDNYNAGHLEAAKQNFDRAFNLLLGSNLDIRSDARLQSEFDKILDGVNGLELMALQEGDGFAEQK
ncbi:MAG: hypothetical protein DMG71_20645 [Acidobacteria bacterium]|nr:MAG: hypothetical protein DMG71_20645 [Acidobacteriota bacterium]